jgi:hypothetical protein
VIKERHPNHWHHLILHASSLDELFSVVQEYEATGVAEQDQKYLQILSYRQLPVYADPDPCLIGSIDEETGEVIVHPPSVIVNPGEPKEKQIARPVDAFSWDGNRVLLRIRDSDSGEIRWVMLPRVDTIK